MKRYYTDERNAQIIVALLKAHGIKRVIASPGSTHMCFLGSVQCDPWFQIWSAIDERHAAFMAVGMAAESGEPVVLTCTGSTASRNYFPALTEAFYRKLPILAITGSQVVAHTGNMFSQMLDRSRPPKDIVKYSLPCPPVENDREARECELAVNKAILELTRDGGGPVHINMETFYSQSFQTHNLPKVRTIHRFTVEDELPKIPANAKIALFIATHHSFTEKNTVALEKFLNTHNAVAICDPTSQWYGAKRVIGSLICAQKIKNNPKYAPLKPDLLIVIGNMSNDYQVQGYLNGIAPTWYVHPDGEARDRFGRLENVFAMPESYFFNHYAEGKNDNSYYEAWRSADADLRTKIPELPFSNLWLAQQILPKLPTNAVLHLGLSTTLQSWTAMLPLSQIHTFSNVGTCGIDGCVSTLLGASLCNPKKLYFGVVGDLTFFYDMNSLGNRHVGKNIRLLLVNNNCGAFFHVPGHIQEGFSDTLDDYMAAGGHFSAKSHDLVRHYASDLGFKYLTANNKAEFEKALPEFLSEKSDCPILFECFTKTEDEAKAWGCRMSIDNYTPNSTQKTSLTDEMKKIVPSRVKNAIKELIK